MGNKKQCAIIIGGYINACSIARALKDISFIGNVFIIDHQIEKSICLADIAGCGAKIIKKRHSSPDDIIKTILGCAGDSSQKHIFFTNEDSIDAVKAAINDGRLSNTFASTGAAIGNDVIFDRYKFYGFVDQLNCIATPKTIDSSEDPFCKFGSTFVLRFKRSWDDGGKLPRLQIITGECNLKKATDDFSSRGINHDKWCYQELLSVSDQHNVSVCGWHDKDYQQYAVTRKVIQHPPGTGNGDVVETVSDFPGQLTAATNCILSAMGYSGPFEMEFVYDLNSKQYKVIELNPRYWMQHPLVDRLTEHSLIKRSLGLPVPAAVPPETLPHRYWVNGNQMLYRLSKMQLSCLPYAVNGWWYPKPVESLRWAFHFKRYKSEANNNV